MPIITSLPVILQNGTTADASQVMANFNAIVNAVNANAAKSGVNSDITNITALTVALSVPQGGTGQQALSANCVVVGEGSNGFNAVGPGTVGQALVSNGSGSDPSFQTINSVPSGGSIWWPQATPPAGWLEAAGQSTAGFPNLIAIYGATLPDMRGEFTRGWDHGRGLDPNAPALLQAVADQFATHTHVNTLTDPQHFHGGGAMASGSDPGFPYNQAAGHSTSNCVNNGGPFTSAMSTDTRATGITITNVAAGGTETAPKYVAWMFIIKT